MRSSQSLTATGAALALLMVLSPRVGSGSPPDGKAADTKPAAAQPAEPKADSNTLTAKEKDYSFTVHRPQGWVADDVAAKEYRGKFLFRPEGGVGKPGDIMLLVSTFHKYDENIALRLETDTESFRKQYPNLEVGTLDVKHPEYATYARAFSQPGGFSQCVAYVNPGGIHSYAFYVALGKKTGPPTREELAAFREVLESLRMARPEVKPEG
jgi:hypothetical protein